MPDFPILHFVVLAREGQAERENGVAEDDLGQRLFGEKHNPSLVEGESSDGASFSIPAWYYKKVKFLYIPGLA
mgnify:CR=1 FL=1